MESQPQNSEFRIDPENFHPCLIHLPAVWELSVTMEKMCCKISVKKVW